LLCGLAVLWLAAPAQARARILTLGQGSWCWFADPRAVQLGSASFVAWIDWTGAIVVAKYQGAREAVHTTVVGYQAKDDHSSPSILVEPDKRLTLFWSGHNGPALKFRTTVRPRDISTWGPLQQVHSDLPGGLGFTYPNPELLPAEHNRLYLFWRGPDWGQDYATRTAAGVWSPARPLIENRGQRPYVKVASSAGNTIGLAFTDGHPRETTTSIYFAAYRAGWLRRAAGRRIVRMGQRPIAPREASLVYNGKAAHASGWVWDVAFDRHRRPVIVYATFPRRGGHKYFYARFNGRRWISHFLTFGGPTISPGTIERQYSGGLTLDHRRPSTVYLSRKVHGSFEIERWTTPDGGRRWHQETVVRTPGQNNVRPVVPRGGPGPIRLLWLHGDYISYTRYRTTIEAIAR
jgi:hypothetical protein